MSESLQERAESLFVAGEFARAQALWLEDLEARRGVDREGEDPSPPTYSLCRLEHDIQQFQHLRARGLLDERYDDTIRVYERLLEMFRSEGYDPSKHFHMPPEAAPFIEASYNRAHHLHLPPALSVSALSPSIDFAEVERRYLERSPELVVIDGLLRPEALEGLRRMCLESTFWFNMKGSYFGAYMRDGFVSGLLFQVASELRERMPRVLGPHRLREMWAYKYDSQHQGIHAHADEAVVNVNFWITPDAANLDPKTGGLQIYDRKAPTEWDFKLYNRSLPDIDAFLASSDAHAVRVAHRQNRAVLFDSSLFHATDEFRFAGGYESRRVNITMLYGVRG